MLRIWLSGPRICAFIAIAALAVATTVCIASEDAPRPRLADSPECKETTARLVQATDARFKEFSPSGENVFFRHPLTEPHGIVLFCGEPRLPEISLSWEDAFPPNAWFALAVKAGHAVTGGDFRMLDKAIRKCRIQALKHHKSEMSEFVVPHATIECQAFTRDGGGVTMNISARDDGDFTKDMYVR